MSFRKPFRSTPVKLGAYYLAKERRAFRNKAVRWVGCAAVGGDLLGAASVTFDNGIASQAATTMKMTAISAGLIRAREPQAGDHWADCGAARAAGTAPIYYGEPGYRSMLDRDGDGIACEPYRGL